MVLGNQKTSSQDSHAGEVPKVRERTGIHESPEKPLSVLPSRRPTVASRGGSPRAGEPALGPPAVGNREETKS